MIFGIDINYLIKVALGLFGLWVLALLAIWIFMGSATAKKFLHYSGKFWWIFVAILGGAAALKGKKRDPRLDKIDSKLEELQRIENKTKEDEAELKRLEEQKKEIEDDIARKTKEYEDRLNDSQNKPDKPGDAGRSSDDMNDAWRG